VVTRVESSLQERPIRAEERREDARKLGVAGGEVNEGRRRGRGDEQAGEEGRERIGEEGARAVASVARRKSATEVTTAATAFGVDVARTDAAREAASTSRGISRRWA
jgi:hypothetical protein